MSETFIVSPFALPATTSVCFSSLFSTIRGLIVKFKVNVHGLSSLVPSSSLPQILRVISTFLTLATGLIENFFVSVSKLIIPVGSGVETR